MDFDKGGRRQAMNARQGLMAVAANLVLWGQWAAWADNPPSVAPDLQTEKQAMEELERRFVNDKRESVKISTENGRVTEVFIMFKCESPSEALRLARSFGSLVLLEIQHPDVTDADLVFVGSMRSLGLLRITRSKVTDAGLAHLRSLKQLTGLTLGSKGYPCKITNTGLKYLSEIESLRHLAFRECSGITDEGLAHFKGSRLEGITLDTVPITNAGLMHLKYYPELKRLDLYHTKVTDDGIEYIKDIPELRELWLGERPEVFPISEANLSKLLQSRRPVSLRVLGRLGGARGITRLRSLNTMRSSFVGGGRPPRKK
jgi:hypothetical protein